MATTTPREVARKRPPARSLAVARGISRKANHGLAAIGEKWPTAPLHLANGNSGGSLYLQEAPNWRGTRALPAGKPRGTGKVGPAGGASGPEIQRSLNLECQTRAGEYNWDLTDVLISSLFPACVFARSKKRQQTNSLRGAYDLTGPGFISARVRMRLGKAGLGGGARWIRTHGTLSGNLPLNSRQNSR